MKTLWVKLLLVLIASLPAALAGAQEDVTHYTVSSTQGARARDCPRTDCAVLFGFEQGEELEVIEIVTGQLVSGNDQWLKVATEDRFVFVHSSLATRSTAAPELETAVEEAEPENASVTTTGWRVHQVGNLSFERPSSLNDATEFFTDDEFLENIAEMYEVDVDEFFGPIKDALESGYLDSYMTDLNTGLSVFITHEDLDGATSISKSFIARILERLEEDNGSEIVSNEIVELPIGETVRLHVRRTIQIGTFDSHQEAIKYAISIGSRIYYVEFSAESSFFAELEPTIESIAATFAVEKSLITSST